MEILKFKLPSWLNDTISFSMYIRTLIREKYAKDINSR
jgi:hypothetical protein